MNDDKRNNLCRNRVPLSPGSLARAFTSAKIEKVEDIPRGTENGAKIEKREDIPRGTEKDGGNHRGNLGARSTRGNLASSAKTKPKPTPVTPRNTFASDSNSALIDRSDLPEVVEAASHLAIHALISSDVQDDLLEHVERGESDEHGELESTCARSELLSEEPASLDCNLVTLRPHEHHRSFSAPSRPLKSAIATHLCADGTPESSNSRKKKARFDDDTMASDLLLRRTATDPPSLGRKEAPTSFSSGDDCATASASLDEDEDDNEQDSEVEAALVILEDVIEEFAQSAQVDEDARKQLLNIQQEVAEAIMGKSDKDYEADDEDEGSNDGHDSEGVKEGTGKKAIGWIRQCSADEVVEESCMEAAEIASLDTDVEAVSNTTEIKRTNHHPHPQVLLAAKDRKIPGPDLQPIAEDDAGKAPESDIDVKAILERRVSDPSPNALNSEYIRRRASMTDLSNIKSRLRLPFVSAKATPAGCAVTACSVRPSESPKYNTVYELPDIRNKPSDPGKSPMKTAQTVQSISGTFQMLWEEPAESSTSSDLTLLDSSTVYPELLVTEDDFTISRAPSPMSKVKTKLAAWSWARENNLVNENGRPKFISLLPLDDDNSHVLSTSHTPRTEDPLSPPNTERPSGASSAKDSAPQSPPAGTQDDEGDEPVELKVRAIISRPSTPYPRRSASEHLDLPVPQSYLTAYMHNNKLIARQLSNLEDVHLKTHRDSTELLHRRENEEKMNQHLTQARNSVALAHSKCGTRHMKSSSDPRHQWIRSEGPPPILDDSPADARIQVSFKAMAEAERAPAPVAGAIEADEAHPDEHVGCPIYEVERPR